MCLQRLFRDARCCSINEGHISEISRQTHPVLPPLTTRHCRLETHLARLLLQMPQLDQKLRQAPPRPITQCRPPEISSAKPLPRMLQLDQRLKQVYPAPPRPMAQHPPPKIPSVNSLPQIPRLDRVTHGCSHNHLRRQMERCQLHCWRHENHHS